jgi:hypothetical protein
VSELFRLGVKLFVTDPSAVRVKAFVGIFHSWIQEQSVAGHQLIDVHDYSHIYHGPGILLVAHEGNFSIDSAEGKLGLAYFRKQTAGKTTEDALRASLMAARLAMSLIESEQALGGKVRFRKDELLVICNDRLLAPNNGKVLEELRPTLARVFGTEASFTHANSDAKARLTIRVTEATPLLS